MLKGLFLQEISRWAFSFLEYAQIYSMFVRNKSYY